jgi:hypothetical protein
MLRSLESKPCVRSSYHHSLSTEILVRYWNTLQNLADIHLDEIAEVPHCAGLVQAHRSGCAKMIF